MGDTAMMLNHCELAILFVANFIMLLLVLPVSVYINNCKLNVGCLMKVNVDRFSKVFSLLIIFNILFTYNTGAQVLFRESDDISFLGAILNPSYAFPLFYISCRNRVNKYFFIAVVFLYCFSEIQKGWTGFLMLIFSLELFFFFKRRRSKIKNIIFIFAAPLIVLIMGGYVYSVVYPMKQYFRNQGEASYITYTQSIDSIASRLTFFPVAIGGYQKADEVREIYKHENIELKEFEGIFKPILPTFVMGSKNFSSLNSDVKAPYFGNDLKTSADMGGVVYLYILFLISPLDMFLVLLFTILMFIFVKLFYDSISEYRGQYVMLIYLCVFNVAYTFSPEHVFSRAFFSIWYVIPILFLTGSVHLRRRRFVGVSR